MADIVIPISLLSCSKIQKNVVQKQAIKFAFTNKIFQRVTNKENYLQFEHEIV